MAVTKDTTIRVTPTGVLAGILLAIKNGTDSGWWTSSPLLTGAYVSGELSEKGIGLVPFADIDAIEAEARAALLAELRAKVEGLQAWNRPWTANDSRPMVDRSAVLALLAEPLGNSKP